LRRESQHTPKRSVQLTQRVPRTCVFAGPESNVIRRDTGGFSDAIEVISRIITRYLVYRQVSQPDYTRQPKWQNQRTRKHLTKTRNVSDTEPQHHGRQKAQQNVDLDGVNDPKANRNCQQVFYTNLLLNGHMVNTIRSGAQRCERNGVFENSRTPKEYRRNKKTRDCDPAMERRVHLVERSVHQPGANERQNSKQHRGSGIGGEREEIEYSSYTNNEEGLLIAKVPDLL